MIQLYDYELSGSCYKVRLLLHILNVQYESVPIDFVAAQHQSAAFLKRNPLGELPVLEDGDLRLRDTQAILVYLASRYDPQHEWYPDDAASRGLVQQWLATGSGGMMNVAAARMVKGLGYPLDLEKLHTGAHRALALLNARLEDRPFLEFGHPTIADIACFPYAALANEAGIDVSNYPSLIDWTLRMRRLPRFLSMPGIAPL